MIQKPPVSLRSDVECFFFLKSAKWFYKCDEGDYERMEEQNSRKKKGFCVRDFVQFLCKCKKKPLKRKKKGEQTKNAHTDMQVTALCNRMC